jgi:hypothetical protein
MARSVGEICGARSAWQYSSVELSVAREEARVSDIVVRLTLEQFGDRELPLATAGPLWATAFRYPSGEAPYRQ